MSGQGSILRAIDSARQDALRTRPETLAWGGVVGPASFTAAWAAAGAGTTGYSPVQEAVSHLAGTRAPTRHLMKAGFVCYGVAVPAYGVALRASLGGHAWLAATVAGLATLGAGAFSLDASSTRDRVHRGCALVGSASLALTPALAARTLSTRGYDRTAGASLVCGMLSGACLGASAFTPTEGLFQRIGLTLANGWLAASAAAILSGLLEPTPASEKEPRMRSGGRRGGPHPGSDDSPDPRNAIGGSIR